MSASLLPLHGRAVDSLGVQLYTLRSILPKDPAGVLKALEQIGYREVELTADNLDKIFPSLRETSLKPVSLHMDSSLFVRAQDRIPAAIEDAAKRGLQFVVCPYVAPQDRGGPDVMRRLGATLAKAGEMARQAGMKMCYHNHAFDFAPAGDKTLLDAMLDESDANLVGLELDIMWAQVAGVDPVAALRKYAGRVDLIHLKNVAGGIAQRYDERVPATAFKDVGGGVIDIPAVLAASKAAGVRRYFVEQDQTPGDPLEALRQSFQYLDGLSPA